MKEEVVGTRKGQTTIPVKLRAKYKIRPGTKLVVEDTKDGIFLKPRGHRCIKPQARPLPKHP